MVPPLDWVNKFQLAPNCSKPGLASKFGPQEADGVEDVAEDDPLEGTDI
jgi:hypothetical protein